MENWHLLRLEASGKSRQIAIQDEHQTLEGKLQSMVAIQVPS